MLSISEPHCIPCSFFRIKPEKINAPVYQIGMAMHMAFKVDLRRSHRAYIRNVIVAEMNAVNPS